MGRKWEAGGLDGVGYGTEVLAIVRSGVGKPVAGGGSCLRSADVCPAVSRRIIFRGLKGTDEVSVQR